MFIVWCNLRAMDMKNYLRTLATDDARQAFAHHCETTLGHLRNVSHGARSLAPEQCVLVERHSKHQVRRWELRPADWHRIWPELIDIEGAPAVPTEEAGQRPAQLAQEASNAA